MTKQLRYTTFQPGELEARLRELNPQASVVVPSRSANSSGSLLNAHTFTVTFPDGMSGTCRYERSGAKWHLFHFRYRDGVSMPRQAVAERLANDKGSIEGKGRELAASCYREAIQVERDHYFRRATEPSDGSRKKRPDRYRMKAEMARSGAGLYAVGRFCGETFFAESPLYSDIERANTTWRERDDPRLVVACCNRLDRCWELPKYNTLYAECDPRPEIVPKEEAAP